VVYGSIVNLWCYSLAYYVRDGPVFVPLHRRLPHVGAKVAFPPDSLLQWVSGAAAKEPNAAPVGFLAFGEFTQAQ
jgi:hypothetical protein